MPHTFRNGVSAARERGGCTSKRLNILADTSSQAPDLNVGDATTIIRLGSTWAPLRRSYLLGGLYVGAGLAGVSVQKMREFSVSVRDVN